MFAALQTETKSRNPLSLEPLYPPCKYRSSAERLFDTSGSIVVSISGTDVTKSGFSDFWVSVVGALRRLAA